MQEEVIEGFRLSPQQRNLWLIQKNSQTFRSECAILIEGSLEPGLLEQALRVVGARNEILRTTFRLLPGMGTPIQVITPDASVSVSIKDVTGGASGDHFEVVEQHLRLDASIPFDFESGPLVRCTLLRFSPAKSALLVSLSSLCGDATTLKNLAALIADSYSALVGGGEPQGEPVQYVDYSEWQNELLEGEGGRPGREFWQQRATSSRTAVPRPGGRMQSPGAAFECDALKLAVGDDLKARQEAVAKEYDAPLPTILLAGFATLVWRLMGQQDLTIGYLCDGRRIKNLAGALGIFAKYLPIESHFESDFRFAEVLVRLKESLTDADARQDYFSTDLLKAGESGGRDQYVLPLKFEWRQLPPPRIAGGAQFHLSMIHSTIDRFTLKLACVESAGGLALEFYYDPSVYAPGDVSLFASRYLTLLESVAADPLAAVERLEVLSEAERRRLVLEWNSSRSDQPAGMCIHELFERQVEKIPDAIAVSYEDSDLSFHDLNKRANQFAHHLCKLGVGPESAVGLCMRRSVEMIVALAGILKAGAAYVPLDPAQPKERLAFILQDVKAKVAITERRLSTALPDDGVHLILFDAVAEVLAAESRENPGRAATPENLAYIIFTSGSTGKPKGVEVQHSSVTNLAHALHKEVYAHEGPGLRVGLNAPLIFDASVKQIIQMAQGHTLSIVPEEARLDADRLLAHLSEHAVDVLDCTPSQLQLLFAGGLAEKLGRLPAVLLVGGEALSEQTWRLLAEAEGKRCYNVYGPTECTVDTTVCRIQGELPTIGRPVLNAQVYLLDDHLRLVPIAVPGELHVGGRGLARGYKSRPDLTAEKFIPDPFSEAPGARLYKTGDRARHMLDGNIEYLGRVDHQVKLQGLRIELGEIESVLREHSAVRDAVVVVSDEHGGKRLVGYVVPKRQHMEKIEGHSRYALPNGKAIVQNNKNETDYLYEEIFEKQVYWKYAAELPEDATVFDVGANIGMFSLFVSDLYPKARIFAFEPIQPIFETLRLNMELYGKNVKILPFGISDEPGTAEFTYYPLYSMMSGLTAYADSGGDIDVVKQYLANQQRSRTQDVGALLEVADDLLPGRFEAETYTCRLLRLSDVIREEGVGRIDLLKVDVQRAELDVLRGIDDADWEKIQQIIMEVHDAAGQESAGRIREIVSLLNGRGFDALAEQDELLAGTDRHTLYAARRGRPLKERAPSDRQKENGRPARAIGAILTAEGLRAFLRERLPEYMVPADLVLLEEMPLTRTGKADRRALPAPDAVRERAERGYVAPGSGVEKTIASIWQQVLRVEKVGRHDNFFDSGGHSLLLVQVQSKLREVFKRDISLMEIFQHPSVASLADFFERSGGEERARKRSEQAAQRARKLKAAAERRKQVMKGRKQHV